MSKTKFIIGDFVKIKKSIKEPKHGFGDITHQDIGTIININSEITSKKLGRRLMIDFERHPCFSSYENELELVKVKQPKIDKKIKTSAFDDLFKKESDNFFQNIFLQMIKSEKKAAVEVDKIRELCIKHNLYQSFNGCFATCTLFSEPKHGCNIRFMACWNQSEEINIETQTSDYIVIRLLKKELDKRINKTEG